MRKHARTLLLASSFLGVVMALYLLLIGPMFHLKNSTFFLGEVSFVLVAIILFVVSILSLLIAVKIYVLTKNHIQAFVAIITLAFLSFGVTITVPWFMSSVAVLLIYRDV